MLVSGSVVTNVVSLRICPPFVNLGWPSGILAWETVSDGYKLGPDTQVYAVHTERGQQHANCEIKRRSYCA